MGGIYILGWEFKASVGEFIIVRVVLCPNCVCSFKKNDKHIIVKKKKKLHVLKKKEEEEEEKNKIGGQ